MGRLGLFLAGVVLWGSACSSDSGESDWLDIDLQGTVEKGPMASGTAVTIARLSDMAIPVGSPVSTTVSSDFGEFKLSFGASPLLSLEGEGLFYQEITGRLSEAPIALRAFFAVNGRGAQVVHVNAVTHMAYERIGVLLDQGIPLAEAIEQAERELCAGLGIGGPGFDPRARGVEMTIAGGDSRGNAYLFAVSAVLGQAAVNAGGPLDGTLSVLLDGLSADLAPDGTLSYQHRRVLAEAEAALDVEAVTDMLERWLSQLGSPLPAPRLDQVLHPGGVTPGGEPGSGDGGVADATATADTGPDGNGDPADAGGPWQDARPDEGPSPSDSGPDDGASALDSAPDADGVDTALPPDADADGVDTALLPDAEADGGPDATLDASPGVDAAAEGGGPDGGQPPLTGQWVLITADAFSMGSPATEAGRLADEEQHEVTLTHDFWLMTTEVTQGQFEDLMGYNPSVFTACGASCPAENASWHEFADLANAWSQAEGLGECYSCTGAGVSVSCAPSGAYSAPQDCPGYRLPTEAEWEFAARAGTTTATYNGDLDRVNGKSTVVDLIGWYVRNSSGTAQAVGQKVANAWELYDLLGNVSEWCHDWYDAYSGGPETDPAGPVSGTSRVVRGGSWGDGQVSARAASRSSLSPDTRASQGGGRLSRTVD